MAEVKYPISDIDSSFGVTGNCTFCGSHSVTYWRTNNPNDDVRPCIEVCEDCSINVLSRLQADSQLNNNADAIKANLERVVREFWKGLAIRLKYDTTICGADAKFNRSRA